MRKPDPNVQQVAPDADLLTMARFLVLPGARQLLETYAAIPPGPVRESLIAHGSALALAYQSAPTQHRAPDPLHALTGAPMRGPPARPALESPGEREPEPKIDSIEMNIVAARMKGRDPQRIAESYEVPLHTVHTILRDARKGGASFPRIGKRKTHKKGFALEVDKLNGQAFGHMTIAAKRRGITLEAYMERRRTAIQLAQAGADWAKITAAVKEPQNIISSWFTVARAAGIPIPYVLAPPIAEVEEIVRVFPAWDRYKLSAQRQIEFAAERRGMTVPAYMDLRESIVRHRKEGKWASDIARITGQPGHFIKDTLDAAKKFGVTFEAYSGLNGAAHP